MLGVMPKYILNATCQGTQESRWEEQWGLHNRGGDGLAEGNYVAREQNCGLCKTLKL